MTVEHMGDRYTFLRTSFSRLYEDVLGFNDEEAKKMTEETLTEIVVTAADRLNKDIGDQTEFSRAIDGLTSMGVGEDELSVAIADAAIEVMTDVFSGVSLTDEQRREIANIFSNKND